MIRKISIGLDLLKAMHYVVGQQVLDKSYTIDTIRYEGLDIVIYIKKEDEIVKWKSLNANVPVTIEYKIDF
jgi:predicted metal-dependent RNase